MAEKDRSPSSLEDIEEQIRKLEKEKEELERINERRRLEQRLQQLQGNVTQLKSGPSPHDNSGRNISSRGRDSGDLNNSLEESQARLRTLQQSVLNSSLGGASSLADDSHEDHNQSSDDAVELDDVMSNKHKQALRVHRDVLVENMTPDDIFNDLISKHILTNSDVSRIKERNTTEAINEELLNVLIRRSDKAFYVFVSSLRRTLQGWLANRIDPNPQPTNKRRRRTGEMNVNIDCDSVVPARNKKFTCTCQEVEEQILIMAKGAFAHIRRRDASPAAFEQFRKEIQQTNIAIKESMEIRNTLKELCRHGDLVNLSEGSVCFTLRCRSLADCQELWDKCHSGYMLDVFQTYLVNPFLLKACGAQEIHLCLRISRTEFVTCALELAYIEQNRLLQEGNLQHVTPIKKRLRKQRSNGKESAVAIQTPVNCQTFTELCHRETLNRQNLRDNMITPLSESDMKSENPLCSSMSQNKSHPLVLPQSSNASPSMAVSSALKKATLHKHRYNSTKLPAFKHQDLLLTKLNSNTCMLKNSFMVRQEPYTSCPYNLRYRILPS
ncbi:caspase-2 [Elysia marginata]|uniref:Caspase-2 n=1 Tax=Elysia marginata TaxID=1093978 RepID=A0AAV4HKT3_9GAST|nr:caspase-2 [Elysia marginata]